MRALLAAITLCVSFLAHANEFSFGLFGDAPYTPAEARAVERVIYEMNREPLAFAVHVGDFKSGASPCTDEVYRAARDLLDFSKHALVYTPGDNEWTDCHRDGAGNYKPSERLAALRKIFFTDSLTRGQTTLPVSSQRDAPRTTCRECAENLRWWHEGILFVTLHVVGSNNNLGRTSTASIEHQTRMRAVGAWFDAALAEAQRGNARAMVIFIHANPWLERTHPGRNVRVTDGFDGFRRQLARVAQRFERPILFAHGDTHHYKLDRPLHDPDSGEPIANVQRVEVWGSPFVNWLRVTVRPDADQPFTIVPSIMQPLTE